MPTLMQLHASGVSTWLDDLSQHLLQEGRLRQLIDLGLRGETSNPTIFEKAITEGNLYDDLIAHFAETASAEAIVWNIMIEDVAEALQHFSLLYESTGGRDGFVSLELHPDLAHDTEGSIAQARELKKRLPQRNLMVKVPATEPGLPAIRQLTAEGFNVNVTLLFSVARYVEVMEAYIAGLEMRVRNGQPIDRIASVASFFVSRVDTEVDKRLTELQKGHTEVAGLHGRAAVANARVAYQRFLNMFCGDRWDALANKGARVQRPLWASTGTKNPAYPDTLYVDALIAPNCVNTMPKATMDAWLDHGHTARSITDETMAEAVKVLDEISAAGVDMGEVTLRALPQEGIVKFQKSYNDLLLAVQRVRSGRSSDEKVR